MILGIVIIGKDNPKDVFKTINSVFKSDPLSILKDKLEIILVYSWTNSKNKIKESEIPNDLHGYRIIENADSGLYDAMNIGLANCNSNFVYFLNSGDSLIPNGGLYSIFNLRNDNIDCMLFNTVQMLSNKAYRRRALNSRTREKFTPGHQGVVVSMKLIKLHKVFYHTAIGNGADTIWIQDIIRRSTNILVVDHDLAQFQLNGISNDMSYNEVLHLIRSYRFREAFFKLIKNLLQLIVGRNNVISFAALVRGYDLFKVDEKI